MPLGNLGNIAILGGHAAAGRCGFDTERMPMLLPYSPPHFDKQDQQLFDRLVPFDHWTRRADLHIDFASLRESVEPFFKDSGRPAVEPVLFIKFELLMYHDRLSDSQVFQRAQTDLAYRRFLGLSCGDHPPEVGTLRKFRARLGVEGHQQLFHSVLAQARGHGLVKDRLRLKDATHVLADIAIPAGIELVAQARNKLLSAAEKFAAEDVAGERVQIETIRASTDQEGNESRLLARIEHLRDILAWVEDLEVPDHAEERPDWQALIAAVEVARKVLGGHDQPSAPGKIRSAADPDARRGKHGEYYDGYVSDVLVDADSELFTAINVYPAGGSESASALVLLEQEQSAHGNKIEKLSIDGAGYDGPVLRELESAEGPNVEVFVPAKAQTNGGKFTTEAFQLSDDGSHMTCPAGEQSQYKQRDNKRQATAYRFNTDTCHSCPLMNRCIERDQKHGRTVHRSDYEPEYEKVRQRSQTEQYAAVKREHPKVERRLGELVNRHGARRARYRGLPRVFVQQILCALTANVKRMVRLLDAATAFAG